MKNIEKMTIVFVFNFMIPSAVCRFLRKEISENTETSDHIKSTRIQTSSHLSVHYPIISENSAHAGKE